MTNMLIEFSVSNFLSFKSKVTLSLVKSALKDKKIEEDDNFTNVPGLNTDILNSAVVYGANASGKSNLIDALMFFRTTVVKSASNIEAEGIDFKNFELSDETLNEPTEFEMVFVTTEHQYTYGFQINKSFVVSEWLYQRELKARAKEIELFFREDQNFNDVHEKFLVSNELIEKKMIRPNALLLSVLAQFNNPIAQEIIRFLLNLNVISGNRDRTYTGYTLSKLKEPEVAAIILKMTQFADLGIDDFKLTSIKDGEEESFSNFDGSKSVPKKSKSRDVLNSFHAKYDSNLKQTGLTAFDFFEDESEGTIKYFSLAGPIIDTLLSGKILFIDELDSKLHPLLTKSIMSLFSSNKSNPHNAQLIFTTHDTNLLSANIFRRDQVWFVQKNRYGASELYSLADYKVRNDASFEKDYLSGKYGAIPIINDFSKLFNKTVAKQE
jgi:AAA15 family ATPase/GTPase